MKKQRIISLSLAICMMITTAPSYNIFAGEYVSKIKAFSYNGYSIPEYDGDYYEIINDNQPKFTHSELNQNIYESYGKLDSLGRVTACMANIDQTLMPTEQRGSISSVYPTGWVQNNYDFVNGKYLYNRSHLIGWQLTGENANKQNLMTGTRTFNVSGMLPFENEVAQYVKQNAKNNVLYRVTPVFEGNNLLANGVIMEAESVDDYGASVSFCVFVYNVEPGVSIDYETGKNVETSSMAESHIHSWNSGYIEEAATCSKSGKKIYTCKNCGEAKTVILNATGVHDTKRISVVKATPKQDGKIEKYCSTCYRRTAYTKIYRPKTVTLSRTSYVYDSKVKKPSVTVKDSAGKTISSNNYTVSYSSGRKYVGKYAVTVKFKNNYSGSITKYFTIVPRAVEIKSIESRSKGFSLKWSKRTAQITGYQIQYSTSSKFTSKATKTVSIKNYKQTSQTFSRLKGKTKYYVRVRVYKTVKNVNYYSAWSKAKAVTTKK